jgi:hypothetical protein
MDFCLFELTYPNRASHRAKQKIKGARFSEQQIIGILGEEDV